MRFIDHLCDNIADKQEDALNQLIAWIADILQQPQNAPSIAVILRGEEKGTGKSIVSEIIEDLMGDYCYKASSEGSIFGRFNGHLESVLFCVTEEIDWSGKRIAGKLKDLITSPTQSIEGKGLGIVMAKKYFRMMLITNSEKAVNASKDERRYLILKPALHQQQNNEYFAPLHSDHKEYKAMLEQLFNLLMMLDYSDIDLKKGVETKDLQLQKSESISPMQEWWEHCLDNDGLYNIVLKGLQGESFTSSEVHQNYMAYMKDHHIGSNINTNSRSFSNRFVNMASGGNQNLVTTGIWVERKRGYQFGSIANLEAFLKGEIK